jgi:hypothetical protein
MKARAIVVLLFLAGAHAAYAKPRLAILTPDGSPPSVRYARALEASLDANFRVVDPEMAASAYASLNIENPFNQTFESAKSIGTITGCDHFILVKAETARRSSSARPSYFEASAFLFIVNGRSGRLHKFLLAAKQADSAAEAEKQLTSDTDAAAGPISASINSATPMPDVEYPAFDSDAKTMRPAMPYRRIKPEYTSTAFLYDVKATVDAEVSIDAGGNVKRIDIVRWAGFGLDETVIEAIHKMNWRAGERDGKPLAMRVLLRYNFTKIEKDPSASSPNEASPRLVQIYGIRDQHSVSLRFLVAAQLLHSE